jgi:glyoxylase-like metal-dependent hydrolase (beta-lactamase superfamily II)
MPADPATVHRHEGPHGERIYRIPVRAFTRLEANVYVVVDGDYTALVDTGSGLPESDADLLAGFEAVSRDFGEAVSWAGLSRIVLTHGHIDHYGGLDFVRERTDAPLAIHAYDRRVIEHHRERFVVVTHGLRRFFVQAGLAGARLEEAMALYHGTRASFRGGPVETALHDGMTLDGRFRVHHVPGHCPGQVCLQLGSLLFSADHVLPATFPHLAPESITPWTGLAHYLEALAKIEALPGIALTLPGHGNPIADLAGRIRQIRASNQRKLDRVLEACAEPRTLDAITAVVYPKVGRYEALLALEKVGAYVEHLDQLGMLAVANLEDVAADAACPPRYRRA